MRQATIARVVEWSGVGLHTGVPVHVTLHPAGADAGIVFARSDLASLSDVTGNEIRIPARHDFLMASSRATTLGLPQYDSAAARVATVEHLLATLYALEIDNLLVRIDGPEMPAMDGSALPVVVHLLAAGRLELEAERASISLVEPIEIRDGDRWIRAWPAERLEIRYSIDFDHPLIGRQSVELLELEAKVFERELAGARTFGFVQEVEALREAGLARGASLDNTLVLDRSGLLNAGGLRFPDEFVRHKVIDLLGDLALLGAPLRARVEAEKGGHTLHHRLVAAIAAATV